MSDDTDKSDEPFFARWSRRKQQAITVKATPVLHVATASEPQAAAPAPLPQEAVKSEVSTAAPSGDEAAKPKPLTEADFDDVNFDALTYGSDYGRFMQDGVPESIRQKALGKLWQSDSIFTAVDPFQDYAGDYTDAATVPKSGIVKTAYKVGQGFLSDDEAHAWHRLGKAPLGADMMALPVLVPGVRVRLSAAEEGAALLAVHQSAILETAGASIGPELAASWAYGLTPEGYGQSIAGGEIIEIAIDEETGAAVAFSGRKDNQIVAVFVHARRARKGLGSALLARGIAAIREAGYVQVALEAAPGTRDFYEREGFAARGKLQKPTRGGLRLEVTIMEKLLTAPAELTITRESPDQAEIRAFFAASEAYMGALYPAESNHFVDASALTKPNVVFLVARGGGKALGCGAIAKAADGSAEIKRMWVSPEARGLKLGQCLMDALIAEARVEAISKLQLETGISQPEALGLYRRSGFKEVAPFGDYLPDPLSVFMERII